MTFPLVNFPLYRSLFWTNLLFLVCIINEALIEYIFSVNLVFVV